MGHQGFQSTKSGPEIREVLKPESLTPYTLPATFAAAAYLISLPQAAAAPSASSSAGLRVPRGAAAAAAISDSQIRTHRTLKYTDTILAALRDTSPTRR